MPVSAGIHWYSRSTVSSLPSSRAVINVAGDANAMYAVWINVLAVQSALTSAVESSLESSMYSNNDLESSERMTVWRIKEMHHRLFCIILERH